MKYNNNMKYYFAIAAICLLQLTDAMPAPGLGRLAKSCIPSCMRMPRTISSECQDYCKQYQRTILHSGEPSSPALNQYDVQESDASAKDIDSSSDVSHFDKDAKFDDMYPQSPVPLKSSKSAPLPYADDENDNLIKSYSSPPDLVEFDGKEDPFLRENYPLQPTRLNSEELKRIEDEVEAEWNARQSNLSKDDKSDDEYYRDQSDLSQEDVEEKSESPFATASLKGFDEEETEDASSSSDSDKSSSIPSFFAKIPQRDPSMNYETEGCFVCMEGVTKENNFVYPNCNHNLCRKCCEEWVAKGHHDCPTCRNPKWLDGVSMDGSEQEDDEQDN